MAKQGRHNADIRRRVRINPRERPRASVVQSVMHPRSRSGSELPSRANLKTRMSPRTGRRTHPLAPRDTASRENTPLPATIETRHVDCFAEELKKALRPCWVCRCSCPGLVPFCLECTSGDPKEAIHGVAKIARPTSKCEDPDRDIELSAASRHDLDVFLVDDPHDAVDCSSRRELISNAGFNL